jgi:uridine phosphorylase
VAHFYPIDFSPEEQALAKAFSKQAQLPSEIIPYCAASNEELTRSFKGDLVHRGITITSSGFYAPQGRSLRIGSKTSELNNNIEQFSYKDMQALNFEMESSALFALGKSMGHRCGTICLGIANRPAMQFSSGYQHEMKQLIRFVLDSL